MNWVNYGFIILIITLILATTIDARGGRSGGGGRRSGGGGGSHRSGSNRGGFWGNLFGGSKSSSSSSSHSSHSSYSSYSSSNSKPRTRTYPSTYYHHTNNYSNSFGTTPPPTDTTDHTHGYSMENLDSKHSQTYQVQENYSPKIYGNTPLDILKELNKPFNESPDSPFNVVAMLQGTTGVKSGTPRKTYTPTSTTELPSFPIESTEKNSKLISTSLQSQLTTDSNDKKVEVQATTKYNQQTDWGIYTPFIRDCCGNGINYYN